MFVLHFACGITINATVDQDKITLDDVFELKVEAIDGSELPQVDVSPLKKKKSTKTWRDVANTGRC